MVQKPVEYKCAVPFILLFSMFPTFFFYSHVFYKTAISQLEVFYHSLHP
jgi:hypothetical protein